MAVFAWGVASTYQPEVYVPFLAARKTLVMFGSLSTFLSLTTLIMIYMCLKNFDKGLKPYVCGRKEAMIMGERLETSLRQEYSLVAQA